ncbi:class I lanthipeptide [Chitinophaga qingshengii]|uniref:Class I lanthipeptide n=1 Tax=Chitinophaga qingshengii TaxID=1569794 RepID=A0ABR7TZ26_9BACT|nr:class I lanthipeptide [Chitinophaga qingshengii]MBC9935053.1 class I lanthipeptide [Chitinophaga qingshengii]
MKKENSGKKLQINKTLLGNLSQSSMANILGGLAFGVTGSTCSSGCSTSNQVTCDGSQCTKCTSTCPCQPQD